MMTLRDKQVIKSIGNHKVLSQEQIQELYFPSYQTCQRRIRNEYIPHKYICSPFYINTDKEGHKTALYRLETAGKKLYKELTGKKYYTPKWNISYLPHLIEVNRILILLEEENFRLEKKIGPVQIDAYIPDRKIAIEVDLSETETKKEIQRQFANYENIYEKGYIEMLIFFSNRANKLYDWAKDIAATDIPVKFALRNTPKIYKIKNIINKQYNTTTLSEKHHFIPSIKTAISPSSLY